MNLTNYVYDLLQIQSMNVVITIITFITFVFSQAMLKVKTKNIKFFKVLSGVSVFLFIINHFDYYTHISTFYAFILTLLLVLFYAGNYFLLSRYVLSNDLLAFKTFGDKLGKIILIVFLVMGNYFVYEILNDKISYIKYIDKTEVDLLIANHESKIHQLDSISNVLNIQLDSVKLKEESLLEQRQILINKINSMSKKSNVDEKFLKEFLEKYKNLY